MLRSPQRKMKRKRTQGCKGRHAVPLPDTFRFTGNQLKRADGILTTHPTVLWALQTVMALSSRSSCIPSPGVQSIIVSIMDENFADGIIAWNFFLNIVMKCFLWHLKHHEVTFLTFTRINSTIKQLIYITISMWCHQNFAITFQPGLPGNGESQHHVTD